MNLLGKPGGEMGVLHGAADTFPVNQKKAAYKNKKEQPKDKDLQHFSRCTFFLDVLLGISAKGITSGLVRKER
jgi:hypothetical protein